MARPRRTRLWARIFFTGLVLWLATVLAIFVTANPNLIPTLVLLGSFLVPVTFVAWAFEHSETGELTPGLVLSTFLTGGILGVLGASVIESYLLHPSPWLFVGVGFIEEAVKLAALALVARRLAVKSVRDGMILGACVGLGFAAFESAGYAFTSLFTERGLSLLQVVQTEILRGLLTPFGHGVWTAILGGVLFSASGRHHFAITGRLLVAYVGVSLLHAVWDSMHQIALLITLLVTGTPQQYDELRQGWMVQPTEEQVNLFTTISWVGLLVVGLIGVGWAYAMWSAGRRRPDDAWPAGRGWQIPIR
jgi:RsiW-degrading membrane proteinase PrsW (M82 family)